jgi:hypothetical protein
MSGAQIRPRQFVSDEKNAAGANSPGGGVKQQTGHAGLQASTA